MTNIQGPVRRLLLAFACVIALGAQAATDVPAANDAKITTPGGRANLVNKAQGGKVKVIITLNIRRPFRPAGYLPGDQAQDQRSAIGEAQSQLMRELAGLQVSEVKHFTETPQMAMAVSAVELDRLLNSPTVQSVAEDELNVMHLDLSVPRIGGAIMAAQGLNGAGVAVAILDTGVQKDHPFLTGAVVSEGCYSTNTSGTGFNTQSLCPAGATSSTATNAALPYGTGVCPSGGCDHGTHVAGITAGRFNGSMTGVAPGASIIAIQVFTRFNDSSTTGATCGVVSPSTVSCVLSYTSDQMAGLQRVLDLRTTYNISSVNMSLGGSGPVGGGYCDTDSRKALIDSLRSFNIATVVSSGNASTAATAQPVGRPACVSSAVSVGATTDSDLVASYSNSGAILSMLAPGSSINSSIPLASYAIYNGTSMAAPHVAGAWALLRQARPQAVVSDVYTALVNTGVPIVDTRTNAASNKPRIQVNLAAATLPFSGNGKTGVFRDGWWYLDANGNGLWDGTPTDKIYGFGMAGDIPVVGDWNGDGKTKIGVFRNGVFYLDYNGNGVWDAGIDKVYSFGMTGDVPVIGDWNHDGKAKVGIFRNGLWALDYNGNGVFEGGIDKLYSFGQAGDSPVVGDWSGNGFSKIGIFRGGWWYVDYNGNGLWDGSPTDSIFSFGAVGDVPVVGDWNGNGTSKIGVFRGGAWYLDYLGTGSWNGTIADQVMSFGASTDKPLVGKSW